MKEEFDFESIKNKAIEQLKAGKPLLGKDGAFAPLLESILNAALEGEMDAHLTEEERQMGNRRNGKMQKQVQTALGEVTVSTPRDRNSSFDPQFIKKRETILAEGVADRIIGLYALGNSTREISEWMEENLGNCVSADTISSITDRVLPEIKTWKSRMLDSVYPIVWMDAIHYKNVVVLLHVQYIMCWVLTGKDIRSYSECIYQEMREQTSGSVYRQISRTVELKIFL